MRNLKMKTYYLNVIILSYYKHAWTSYHIGSVLGMLMMLLYIQNLLDPGKIKKKWNSLWAHKGSQWRWKPPTKPTKRPSYNNVSESRIELLAGTLGVHRKEVEIESQKR